MTTDTTSEREELARIIRNAVGADWNGRLHGVGVAVEAILAAGYRRHTAASAETGEG